MKERPQYFLSEENIDHNGELFDYIKELHNYLWRFVRVYRPGAGGSLSDWLDVAISNAETTGFRTCYDCSHFTVCQLCVKASSLISDSGRLLDERASESIYSGLANHCQQWEHKNEKG